ncbi:MAG: NAD(P)H-dependent oxidoreductase subunit E [Candidatus Hydrogenedentes bacterium]|nr:NAD(P)H-dependent oxidoreductase subunit E [Candidatus Hydrogenedentota bacterium]
MRELSLHILDLIENAIRAGASTVAVSVHEDLEDDLLEIGVEDNGSGLSVTPEQAVDPYYTTKRGKRTGLGLSLFKASAEQAGGGLAIEKSALGGVAVRAWMQLEHVDRRPLGDLATTLSSIVCTNPGLDVWCRISSTVGRAEVRASDVAKALRADDCHGLAIARRFSEELSAGLAVLKGEGRFPATRGEGRAGGRLLPESKRRMEAMTEQQSCCCATTDKTSEEELLRRLDEVIAEYREKPGALIPVLQMAQAIFGYLPEEALKRISLGLNKPYSEVAGVVGFYSFFSTEPRGKHTIRVCLGTACYVRGGKQVLEALQHKLGIDVGGTTADRMFSLEVARCFGACGLAPAIMIDDDVHQRVKPARIQAILDQYTANEVVGAK